MLEACEAEAPVETDDGTLKQPEDVAETKVMSESFNLFTPSDGKEEELLFLEAG